MVDAVLVYGGGKYLGTVYKLIFSLVENGHGGLCVPQAEVCAILTTAWLLLFLPCLKTPEVLQLTAIAIFSPQLGLPTEHSSITIPSCTDKFHTGIDSQSGAVCCKQDG